MSRHIIENSILKNSQKSFNNVENILCYYVVMRKNCVKALKKFFCKLVNFLSAGGMQAELGKITH